jgi:hypothetical protein
MIQREPIGATKATGGLEAPIYTHMSGSPSENLSPACRLRSVIGSGGGKSSYFQQPGSIKMEGIEYST